MRKDLCLIENGPAKRGPRASTDPVKTQQGEWSRITIKDDIAARGANRPIGVVEQTALAARIGQGHFSAGSQRPGHATARIFDRPAEP